MKRHIALLLIAGLLLECTAQKNVVPIYPNLVTHENVENYFGTAIRDSLISLEDLDNKHTIDWYKSQDSLSNVWFDKSDFLKTKYASYKDFSKQRSRFIWNIKTSDKGSLLYLKRYPSEDTGSLFLRNGSIEELLFKPSEYKDGNYNLVYFEASYSENYIALAMNNGTPTSHIVILDVKSKTLLDIEPIPNTRPEFAGGIDWLHDESGFTYLNFPNTNDETKVLKQDTQTVLYDIESQQSNPFFGKDTDIDFSNKHYPVVSIVNNDENYIYGRVGHAGRYWTTYVTERETIKTEKPKWKAILHENDKVLEDYSRIKNEKLYFVTEINNSTKIISKDIQGQIKGSTLWSSDEEETIQDLVFRKDKIVFTTLKGTTIKLYTLTYDGLLTDIKMPEPPTNIKILSQLNDSSGQKVIISSTTRANFIANIVENSIVDYPFNISDEFTQFKNIITETLQATSHDGESIPITIIKLKDNNKPSKLMLEAYGAYGDVLKPTFDFVKLKWILEGGKVAIAHVRGGGAKGILWHKAGMKEFKPNSWKDLNSCADELIDKNVAAKGKLVLFSNSSGGITLGMAINERPELYAAMALMSPRLNPIRLQKSNKGSTSFEEYGSMDNKNEAQAIINMDPYHNLKKDITYPPIYIIAGYKDDRVPPADPGKYIATLQKINPRQTFLLDFYFNRGHRVYSWGAMAKAMNFFDFFIDKNNNLD